MKETEEIRGICKVNDIGNWLERRRDDKNEDIDRTVKNRIVD